MSKQEQINEYYKLKKMVETEGWRDIFEPFIRRTKEGKIMNLLAVENINDIYELRGNIKCLIGIEMLIRNKMEQGLKSIEESGGMKDD